MNFARLTVHRHGQTESEEATKRKFKIESSVSDSSFLHKSGDSVAKSGSKKQGTTDQTVSTPISRNQSLSQFEFLPRSTSDTNRMDKGSNPTDGPSATTIEVFSPRDSQRGHASHLSHKPTKVSQMRI